jgi:hypothetical protein
MPVKFETFGDFWGFTGTQLSSGCGTPEGVRHSCYRSWRAAGGDRCRSVEGAVMDAELAAADAKAAEAKTKKAEKKATKKKAKKE